MKRLAVTLGLILLLASVAAAADLTGSWSGSFVVTNPDGQTNDETAFFNLKQDGTAITGTAGPNAEKQWTIQNGKIEGDKLTFDVQTDGPVLKFELMLVDGHLKGEAKSADESLHLKAAVDVQRGAK